MEKAGKSQGEGIQGQGQMVLQKKCEAFWQSWRVGGDENGSGQGRSRCSKSELEVLILFGEKLNPSSWQPGVSQTPAQLLALRFPPAGTQVPCCSGRCTGTCSKSRRCQDKAATLARDVSQLQRALPLCTGKGRTASEGG